MHMFAPRMDVPAYVGYELDRGDYGHLMSSKRPARWPSGGGRWVDIGANLGFLSIALALANPRAYGVAFEPNPSTFAFLERNIAANGVGDRVKAINAGVTLDGRPIQMPRCMVLCPASLVRTPCQARPVLLSSSTRSMEVGVGVGMGSCEALEGPSVPRWQVKRVGEELDSGLICCEVTPRFLRRAARG